MLYSTKPGKKLTQIIIQKTLLDMVDMIWGLILEGDIDVTGDVEEIESSGSGEIWQENPQGRK